jgi:hypothetical protein
MATKTFASGEVLIAADVNQYLNGGFTSVETGPSQAISSGGTTITFTASRFASAPNVQVTQAASGGGASKVPNVDSITSSSFRVFLLDTSNSFVSGNATWLATLEA